MITMSMLKFVLYLGMAAMAGGIIGTAVICIVVSSKTRAEEMEEITKIVPDTRSPHLPR